MEFYKQNKIKKVDISLKQLIDLDTTNELYNKRLDNIRPNQILTSTTNSLRKDVFRFKYLSDFLKAGTGISISSSNGVATISATGGGGGVYTVDNGLTESPAGNFQLGGLLTQTTAIDGDSNIYSIYLQNMDAVVATASNSISLSASTLGVAADFQLSPASNTSIWTYNTGSQRTEIELLGSRMYIRTPNYLTASNGDVLTLMDNTTGEVEYQPSSGAVGGNKNYYLNGGTNQGTFSGDTYYEMHPIPVVGTNADFNISSDGYITQFITDSGDPNQTVIPAGNWNFEIWFSASSSGGSPSFYVELYKWDGASFTLIASSSATPESITNGTAIDLYTTALAIPQTTLTSTDRLAIRIWVTHSGRTITLHTQDSHLCQVITTFASGVLSLNGLSAQVQTFATGTSGTDFAINSSTSTHTFNLPVASSSNTGKLSSTDWSTFNNKVTSLSAGTGISIGGTTTVPIVTNTAPDQTVALTQGTGVVITGTYPNFTIAGTPAIALQTPYVFGTHAVNQSIGAGATLYWTDRITGNGSAVLANRQCSMSFAGTADHLQVRTGSTQPASGSLVVTIQKNGVDTALTRTIAASSVAAVYEDLVNSFTFVDNDLISIKAVNNATAAAAGLYEMQCNSYKT